MDEVERQRAHFENIAGDYYAARQQRSHLLFKTLLWEYALRRRAWPERAMDVLEPMCGYGEGRKILAANLPAPIRYTGFDYSATLVEEAQRENPGVQIFLGDVTGFEGQEDFDLVILIGGLHHVYSHAAPVLGRLASALRPGGWFINFEPTQANPLYRWIRQRIYRANRIFDAETEQAFELGELNRLYREAGLKVEDQIYPGLLAYILYYNPDAFPRLNVGGEKAVRGLFTLEKPFYRTALARTLSFATLTLLRKS